MTGWHRFDPDARRLTLTVHVQPNAAASAVAGIHGDALKIRIAAPAVDNKANAALIDFLHRLLNVPASQINLRRGAHGRRKIIEITNANASLLTRLKAAVGQ
ncbi:MAG: hypothetical protein A3G24_07615 [Betaproteobacteria bacterium RIFCSPLOWO2_12_FULL_62_13]|nr:MAG: hypothetical protein A3G24_07615 [Betaproteobacteria bacterium RIFCSPLOWO2_12_FULL_62_13]